MARQDAGAAAFVERFFQFSVLGLVASGYLAVAGSGYLDAPTMVLAAAGLLLRGLAICGLLQVEISDRKSTLFTIAYAGFFLADYFLLSRAFLAATVHLVFYLAVLKILTSKTLRDDLYTATISFLELLAAAILSVNLNFFFFLALYLAFGIAALTSGEIRRSMRRSTSTARTGLKRFHPRLAGLSVFVTAGILALTAGLFFILPRTADAAFSRLVSHRIFLPGFSDQVILGEIGEIKSSSRAIMHVRIWSREVPAGVKWRGGVLAEFDGRRWSDADSRKEVIPVENGHVALAAPGRSGRHITYDVELEAIDTNALFFAGVPETLDVRARSLLRTRSGAYQLGHFPGQGFRYTAYSLIEEAPENAVPYPAPLLPLAERERNLQQPKLDARIAELARAMTADARSDLARARALERRLRTGYRYSLELPSRETADPLADFLFTRKRGYCEYFASAMAVMLRTLGIPARLATGFQSGIYNPMTDLWLVRASDAHSWVEAWIPGHGWAAFDPTPPDASPPGFALFSKLTLYLDAAQTFWHDWVVSYDTGRQGTLANQMEQGARRMGIQWFDQLAGWGSDWDGAVRSWFRRFGLRIAVTLVLGVWIWLAGPPLVRLVRMRRRVDRIRRGQVSVADATLLYERMLRVLRRRGYQKPGWFTPAEFAASLPRTPLGLTVGEFTTAYNSLRFGSRTDAAPRLSALLDELEHKVWSPAPCVRPK